MPATIELGPTPIQRMQSPETNETVPIVSDSEGENPIDTLQTTHEVSQQESPEINLLHLKLKEFLDRESNYMKISIQNSL
jgi:hypothetical protein